MNARVFLLVLVSALFMGAWNGDQKTMQAAIARREQLREEAWAKVSDATPARESTTAITVAMKTVSDVEPEEQQSLANDESVVPLPPGIVAGNYRAVSQTGTTREITIPPQDSNKATGRDFYMVDAEDGDRWYLIRIR